MMTVGVVAIATTEQDLVKILRNVCGLLFGPLCIFQNNLHFRG